MSRSILERTYKCWNDCVEQGCPSHTAKLTFQSVSDSLEFDDGKGQKFYIQTPELEAFIEMLRELSGWRVEIDNIMNSRGVEQKSSGVTEESSPPKTPTSTKKAKLGKTE